MSLTAIDFEQVITNIEGGTITDVNLDVGLFMGDCVLELTVEHRDAPTVLMRVIVKEGTMIVVDPLPPTSPEARPHLRDVGDGLCHSVLTPGVAVCGYKVPKDEPWCCGADPSCGRTPCSECEQICLDQDLAPVRRWSSMAEMRGEQL